jgi:hypothetical protein
MLRADLMINADNVALQKTSIAFDGTGVDVFANVDSVAAQDGIMSVFPRKTIIQRKFSHNEPYPVCARTMFCHVLGPMLLTGLA